MMSSATPIASVPRAPEIAAAKRPARGLGEWRRWSIAALLVAALFAALGLGAPSLGFEARVSLLVFGVAIIAWTVLRMPDAPVAIGAALAIVLSGAAPASALFATLGHPMIWLLVAAFLMAAALKKSGVAERAALRAVSRIGSVRALFYALTLIIVLTAFLVPSTSGRAALLLPVFVGVTAALKNERITRALALLFPTAILLSACASLIGAGAHLVAVEFMAGLGTEINFLRWLALARHSRCSRPSRLPRSSCACSLPPTSAACVQPLRPARSRARRAGKAQCSLSWQSRSAVG